ncbi:hypothetical protein BJY04DRAFT_221983 [Aspergillus karnatakaensis]|uniref:LysM peptidoglycan-binding domain-containing protein n=1 Tax=Aspergillus karnatakaensis TaxID=1810916 RepID=UPI003CCD4432
MAAVATALLVALDSIPLRFATWNPLLFELSATSVIIPDYDYCVGVNFSEGYTGPSIKTTPSWTLSLTNIPTTTRSIALPDHIPGSVPCGDYYSVTGTGNETCTDIASRAGISVDELYRWNIFIPPDCFLEDGEVLCIGLRNSTSHSSADASAATVTTLTAEETSTPSPTETTSFGNRTQDSCATAAAIDIYVSSICPFLGLGHIGRGSTSTIALARTATSISAFKSPFDPPRVSCDLAF